MFVDASHLSPFPLPSSSHPHLPLLEPRNHTVSKPRPLQLHECKNKPTYLQMTLTIFCALEGNVWICALAHYHLDTCHWAPLHAHAQKKGV